MPVGLVLLLALLRVLDFQAISQAPVLGDWAFCRINRLAVGLKLARVLILMACFRFSVHKRSVGAVFGIRISNLSNPYLVFINDLCSGGEPFG